MECFKVDFLRFSSMNVKILLLGRQLDTYHQIQANQSVAGAEESGLSFGEIGLVS